MAEAIARRKLEAGLITEEEFQMIIDCDALVGFDEEGGLDGDLHSPRGANMKPLCLLRCNPGGAMPFL
jgi:hypothetical protein